MESKEFKNKLAENINYEGEMYREMAFAVEQDYKVGDIVKLGQSWTDGGNYSAWSEFGGVKYGFYCKSGRGHKVDYDALTDDEAYLLGCEDCESENEILVSNEQEFRITSISTEEDFEEMGFYSVDVEMI